MKVAPSSTTCQAALPFGSTNCGMKAPKNNSAFGLLRITRKPCRKKPDRGGDLGGARGGAAPPGSSSPPGAPQKLQAQPDQVGGAGEPHPVEPDADGGDDRCQPDAQDRD